MPNTGRFYAPPAAAAAYRERYMRPYSTVSPPMGGAGHVSSVTAGQPKSVMPSPPYTRATLPLRRPAPADSDGYTPFGNAYESRVRSRPSAAYEEERRWGDAYAEKQFARPRTWSEEDVSVHRSTQQSSVGAIRSIETGRRNYLATVSGYEAASGLQGGSPFETSTLPSALPRLSSLLKRSSPEVERFESEDQFLPRKRARELSPKEHDLELRTKMNRRFYDEDVYAERRAVSQQHDAGWSKGGLTQELRHSRREMPMSIKNPGTFMTVQQRSVQPNEVSPLPSTRQFGEQSRYPYVTEEEYRTSSSIDQSRRSRAPHPDQATVLQESTEAASAYDVQRRSYYSPDNQRALSGHIALNSPRPTTTGRDHFSPVGRYSESNEADCVIEAAADLVEERSPSKRESITKLLLKSKEFLKAKSLVRNRNNEIDWVATFLNVGFESNSIYSLMCPLRKGRWKVEEEKYTMELLRLIEGGAIRLRHGQSIRGFIAKKLHSDDMRVLKKLSNCKMFHFARLINPRMTEEEEIDDSLPNVRASLERLEKLKAEFLRSVQLEALVAVRKYLSDTSIRDLLNARD